MKRPPAKEILELDPRKVKVMIHRERDAAKFERVSAAMDGLGQILPGQVRDIRHWPREKRKRPEGGLYNYELVTGEGRLLRAMNSGQKFRATVENESEQKIVGFFLAENLIREPLPWYEKARLVKLDLDAGMSLEDVAGKYFVTEGHAAKFRRILDRTPKGAEKLVGSLAMNEAEVLATLPTDQQAIVLEVFAESDAQDIRAVTRRAQRIVEEKGELSKTDLKTSLRRVETDLRDVRESMKVTRLHHAIGPMNLAALLREKGIRDGLRSMKVNLDRWEKSSR